MKKVIIALTAFAVLSACGPDDYATPHIYQKPDAGEFQGGNPQGGMGWGDSSNTQNVYNAQVNDLCQNADCGVSEVKNPQLDAPIDPLNVMDLKDAIERQALKEKYRNDNFIR